MEKMEAIKIEPFGEAMSEQRENLLLLLGRMRQMQAVGAPSLNIQPQNLFKRSASSDDQPLDFSAPAKHPRMSPDWLAGQQLQHLAVPDNKHDSLGSDGVSDVSSHSPGSNSGRSLSGEREPRPGSVSPPRPELPSLSIPSPNDTTDSSINKSDLLTTVSISNPHKYAPILKPIASLTEDTKPQVPLHLPFNSLPVFPQSLKPAFPQSSLPFPFPPVTNPTPATEMTKLSMDSQEKYAEFRDKMMKNIETTRVKGGRQRGDFKDDSESNVSLDMTPQHHSTPTRDGKDAAYWERRRKNNEAAKRSRDARRQKENEIAVRASFLEQENIQLKMELVQLRTELGAMRDQVNRQRPLQPTV